MNDGMSSNPKTSNRQDNMNSRTWVMTTMDAGECTSDLGDERNVQHLYGDAVRQISNSSTRSRNGHYNHTISDYFSSSIERGDGGDRTLT